MIKIFFSFNLRREIKGNPARVSGWLKKIFHGQNAEKIFSRELFFPEIIIK